MVLGTSGGGWGGLEKHTLELARALARTEQICLIADAVYAGRFDGDIEFIPINMRRSRYNPLLWLGLRGAINRWKPDVVHGQGSKAAALLTNQPSRGKAHSVATIHSLKSGAVTYAALEAVIAVSGAVANRIDHHEVHLIYNGIERAASRSSHPELGAKARLRGANEALVVGVGRLEQVKGWEVLLHAWNPSWPAKLAIIGDGSQRASLEQLIARRGLKERVFLPGHSTEVFVWLERASLFVSPSLREGFSYAVVEALQAGLPVIATDTGIAAELLPAEDKVRPGDAADLRRALERALASPAALADRQSAIRSFAARELTLETMTAKTLRLYQTLTASRITGER